MSYIPCEEIFKNGGSIYKITIAAARRAIELNNGSPKLVDTLSTKFSTIALEEMRAGKVKYKVKEQDKS